MALGVDQQAARILIDWGLSWTAVIPCGDQDKFWTNDQKKKYQHLLKLAPFKKVLYPSYQDGCMQARNRWMIERSCACLAVWKQWKTEGGTYHTVQAAKKEGLAIADLPGCLSQGDTLEEAVANIQDAKTAWIETAWECGDEIPLPS